MGVTAIIGYLFRFGTGNKLLEQPLPHKIVIVVCMLIFLYNIGMTIKKSGRFTTTEGVLVLGWPAPPSFPSGAAALRELHRLHLLPLVDDSPVGRRRVDDDHGLVSWPICWSVVGRRSRSDGEMAVRDRRPGVRRRHSRHCTSLLLGRCAHVLAADRRSIQRTGAGSLVGMAVYAYAAMRRSGSCPSEFAGVALGGRQRHLHVVRRRPAGPCPYLARRQQMDSWHADYGHARPLGLLRRLCDDRSGDDLLCDACV